MISILSSRAQHKKTKRTSPLTRKVYRDCEGRERVDGDHARIKKATVLYKAYN